MEEAFDATEEALGVAGQPTRTRATEQLGRVGEPSGSKRVRIRGHATTRSTISTRVVSAIGPKGRTTGWTGDDFDQLSLEPCERPLQPLLHVVLADLHAVHAVAHGRSSPAGRIGRPDAGTALAEAFQRLMPGRQRSCVIHPASARRLEPRVARIAKARDRILADEGATERRAVIKRPYPSEGVVFRRST